jgi:glycosyltransferase involved in cell wall biosynthesis
VPFARRISASAHAKALLALIRLFRAERPDVVHAHMPISGFLARLAARAVGVPHVAYTCHGFLFNQEGSELRRTAALAMEWIGARATDTFLTVSDEEAADARRFRLARQPVAIGNGRDPAVFHPDTAMRGRVRAQLGTSPDRVVVIAVSRLVQSKGYPELITAMQALPEAELWVVGDRLASDRGEDMDALFATAGLGPRLRRLGYREDVAALLAAADIFVLPSYFEGLPMSVIEAMLTGLPVVASNIRGLREQVVDGTTGLLVPPRNADLLADALRRLAANAALRLDMGRAGQERALRLYDETKVVDRTLDLLGL